MCRFFSFISDGKGNVFYFNSRQRKQLLSLNYNMDSHSSLAEYYFKSSVADDRINKYEFNKHGFKIDQINVRDDSKQIKKWITKFQNSKKFEKLCNLTVKQNPNALQFVPEKYITEKLCELAVKNNAFALMLVPDKFVTEKLCEYAVTKNGNSLQVVPERFITEYICEIAVKRNGCSLQYVPERLKEIIKRKVGIK